VTHATEQLRKENHRQSRSLFGDIKMQTPSIDINFGV